MWSRVWVDCVLGKGVVLLNSNNEGCILEHYRQRFNCAVIGSMCGYGMQAVCPNGNYGELRRNMATRNIHEQFERADVPLPSDRSTGLVFAVMLAIVGYMGRSNNIVLLGALAACGLFVAISLLKPAVLHPLNVAWMRLAHLLNKLMSPVVMGVLFAGVILPAGLLMRCVYDPLQRRRLRGKASYWRDCSVEPRSGMTNQF